MSRLRVLHRRKQGLPLTWMAVQLSKTGVVMVFKAASQRLA